MPPARPPARPAPAAPAPAPSRPAPAAPAPSRPAPAAPSRPAPAAPAPSRPAPAAPAKPSTGPGMGGAVGNKPPQSATGPKPPGGVVTGPPRGPTGVGTGTKPGGTTTPKPPGGVVTGPPRGPTGVGTGTKPGGTTTPKPPGGVVTGPPRGPTGVPTTTKPGGVVTQTSSTSVFTPQTQQVVSGGVGGGGFRGGGFTARIPTSTTTIESREGFKPVITRVNKTTGQSEVVVQRATPQSTVLQQATPSSTVPNDKPTVNRRIAYKGQVNITDASGFAQSNKQRPPTKKELMSQIRDISKSDNITEAVLAQQDKLIKQLNNRFGSVGIGDFGAKQRIIARQNASEQNLKAVDKAIEDQNEAAATAALRTSEKLKDQAQEIIDYRTKKIEQQQKKQDRQRRINALAEQKAKQETLKTQLITYATKISEAFKPKNNQPEETAPEVQPFIFSPPSYTPSTPAQTLSPGRDVVNFSSNTTSPEALEQLYFELISGYELVNIARRDTIDGQSEAYTLISNLSSIRRNLDPSIIIYAQEPFRFTYDRYAIDLNDRIPSDQYLFNNNIDSFFYIDDNGDLVIELDNLKNDEEIELQIANSGKIT